MTDDNDKGNGDANSGGNANANASESANDRSDWREAIWSVPRHFVFAYFALVTGIGWPTLTYILWQTASGVDAVWSRWPFELVIAAAPRMLTVGGGIAIYALFTVQGAAFLMVLYEFAVNRWVKPVIKRHKDEGRAEGREEGITMGLEEGITTGLERADQQWREWLARKTDAESRGLPFDDPPPNETR